MSGIAAVVRFDGAPVAPGAVESMMAAMAHRGPDGMTYWHGPSVALGHALLRTTPQSSEEAQPLHDEASGLVLVMDGRIDNRAELRRALVGKGQVPRSDADSELVLCSYRLWGEACVDHIDGDFAILVWDERRQALFCARDRMGNKPFFWHWSGRCLVVASELQAVWHQMSPRPTLNEGMLSEYLAVYMLSMTETLWEGLQRLAPAHRMWVDAGGSRLQRYWLPDVHHRLELDSDEAYVEHYKALLFDVVERLSVSDHPLAYEVSGGLDSSALFAVADDLQRRGRLQAPAMAGYNLCFEGDAGADESAYCRAVARHTGGVVHEIRPQAVPFGWYVERARRFKDFPDFPNGAAMGMPVAQLAREHGARVVFNGVGGDQWLCGSRLVFAEALQRGQLSELAHLLAEHAAVRGYRGAAWALLRLGLFPLLPTRLRQKVRSLLSLMNREGEGNAGDLACLSADMRQRYQQRRSVWEAAQPSAFPRAGQRAMWPSLNDAYQIMANELSERELAFHGLELRQPFWNARMVEFAMATPDRLKWKSDQDKWMHRQAMNALLPREVLQRTDKAEFSILFGQALASMGSSRAKSVVRRRERWLTASVAETGLASFAHEDRSEWDISAFWTCWTALTVDLLSD